MVFLAVITRTLLDLLPCIGWMSSKCARRVGLDAGDVVKFQRPETVMGGTRELRLAGPQFCIRARLRRKPPLSPPNPLQMAGSRPQFLPDRK